MKKYFKLYVSLVLIISPLTGWTQEAETAALARQIQSLAAQVNGLASSQVQANAKIDSLSENLSQSKQTLDETITGLKSLTENFNASKTSPDDLKEVQEGISSLGSDLDKVKVNLNAMNHDLESLLSRFAQGSFEGTLTYVRDETATFSRDDQTMAIVPKGITVVRNVKDPFDLYVDIQFYLTSEKYNEAINKGKPATNGPVTISLRVPAHLIASQPIPLTLPFVMAQANYTGVTANLTLPFEGFPGLTEKALLTITQLSADEISGKIELNVGHKTSKNKVQLLLSFKAPLDRNPFVVGGNKYFRFLS